MKKIYIIEAKISIEKLERLRRILDTHEQVFTTAESCTRADYIVTELKSPSRIVKNSKRSNCPVVHISWLLDSIRQGTQLKPDNFLIDVSEAREQEAVDLASRVPVRTLPNQLTWNQVAARRRMNKNNSMYDGLQERRKFQYAFGSKAKSFQTDTASAGCSIRSNASSTALSNLEREINRFATTVSPSPDKMISTTTPLSSKESSSSTALTIIDAIKVASPSISTVNEPTSSQITEISVSASSASGHPPDTMESTGVIAPVAISMANEEPDTYDTSSTRDQIDDGTFVLNPSAQDDSAGTSALDRLRQMLFATASTPIVSSTKNHTTASKRRKGSPKRSYADIIKSKKPELTSNLQPEEQNQPAANSSAKRCRNADGTPTKDEESNITRSVYNNEDILSAALQESPKIAMDLEFSVISTARKEDSFSSHLSQPRNEEKGSNQCRCSVKQITRSLSLSPFEDPATAIEAPSISILPQTCSSASSSDFDSTQYSLSAILSL